MTASTNFDLEMQALPESSKTLSIPGGDLNGGVSAPSNPPDIGSGNPSLARENSQKRSKGRSKKAKSANGSSRIHALPFGRSQNPETANVISSRENREVNKDPKANNDRRKGGEAEWTLFAKALDAYDGTIMDAGKDSIDSLLVFAGLFSAVVTTFCILSVALLQPDPTDSTAEILAQISQQLASLSIEAGHITSVQPPYTPPARFRAAASQVVVNILWFSSLILALMSASLGIVVKQWLKEYVATTSSEPMQHVSIRQYRFDGLRRWRVNAIMRLLPLLLQIALLLFFVGLATLLWTISTPVAAVGTILVVTWLTFWLTSIFLPAFYTDCPYKSAESTIFFMLVQRAKSIFFHAIRGMARHMSTHVNRYKKLAALLLEWKDMKTQCYDSWRDREKVFVQGDMDELSLRALKCAEEILMDESIMDFAVSAYVKSSGLDPSVDVLLDRFCKVAGCSEKELESWFPKRSRRNELLFRLTLDALVASGRPFYFWPQEADGDIRKQRRELLLAIVSRYITYEGQYSLIDTGYQELIDMLLCVDLMGASSEALEDFTGTLHHLQLRGHVVKVDAILALAGYASEYSSSEDFTQFLSICQNVLRLLGNAEDDEIAHLLPRVSPIFPFEQMFVAMRDTMSFFQQCPDQLPKNCPLGELCKLMCTLAKKHPVFKSDMYYCAQEILSLHMSAHSRMPALQSDEPWTMPPYLYQESLNSLWGMCNVGPPPSSLLIPPAHSNL